MKLMTNLRSARKGPYPPLIWQLRNVFPNSPFVNTARNAR